MAALHRFHEVMADRSLPGTSRLVYFWMRTLANKRDGYCYSSRHEIAERVGITDEACSDQISALEKAGYITRANVRGLGTGRKKFGIVEILIAVIAAHTIGAAEPAAAASLGHSPTQIAFSGQRRRRKKKVA